MSYNYFIFILDYHIITLLHYVLYHDLTLYILLYFSADEKRILDLGVDKLAARYWQIEGNAALCAELKKNGKDALQEASRQILFEYRELEKKEKKENKEEIGINLKNLNENTECRKNSVNEADNENIVDCDDVKIEIITD